MSMNWNQMREAFEDAKRTVEATDAVAGEMAKMLKGRLRNARISGYDLAALKAELRGFDASRKRWKPRAA